MLPLIRQQAEFTAPFEGWREIVYLDSKKIPSVAYGFNMTRRDAPERLRQVGLDHAKLMAGTQVVTRSQGLALMEADLSVAFNQATLAVPGLMNLPDIARLIVVDFVYNLGAGGFRGFPGFISAINGRDWALAAAELLFTNVGQPKLTGYWQDTRHRAAHHVSALLKLHKERVA